MDLKEVECFPADSRSGGTFGKRNFKAKPLTFPHSVDGDEETLRGTLVVQVTEGEAEAVVTFEPGGIRGGSSVSVPQAVHLHVVLSEVLCG